MADSTDIPPASGASSEAVASSEPANGVFAPWLDTSNNPLIRFEGVTKRYGNFVAIDNLTLDVYEREFYALLGPSGCGKTTMLRLLAGFEQPTEGRILVGGEDITNIPPNKRPINMMFQSYALFPHMTVEKNIGFGLKQERMPAADIRKRVDEMLQLVQLEEFAKRKPHQLSGGQRQRVALARSLAKSPKLLLLDEPLGALDKKLREQTQFELMSLQEELGLTFMIVTHDQEEAMTVASRIAVMDKGLVVQVDTPADIYERPESRYVADFIGDVNFIESTVDDVIENQQIDDQSLVTNDLANLSIDSSKDDVQTIMVKSLQGDSFTATAPLQAKTGDKIWLAIRPEKISVSKVDVNKQDISSDTQITEDDLNVVKGKVWDIAYSGNMSTYHVKLDDGSIIKAQAANQRRLSNREISWEDEVWLSWTRTAAIVLTQ